MRQTPFSFRAAGMILLSLTLATPSLRAEIINAKKSWPGQLANLKLEKEAPVGGVIGTKEDFVKLWKAWMGKEPVPAIDFEKEFVAVLTDRTLLSSSLSIALRMNKGDALPLLVASSRAKEKKEKKEGKGFAFAISVFPRAGIQTVYGKKLPSPILADNLRREIKELQTRVEELERKLSEPGLKKLRGTWKVSQSVANGRAEPAEEREKMHATIRGNTIVLKIAKHEDAIRIFLDPTAKPAAIDLFDSKRGDWMKGIYELDKDTLKICFMFEGKERPKAFSSKKDEGTVLMVFQRAGK